MGRTLRGAVEATLQQLVYFPSFFGIYVENQELRSYSYIALTMLHITSQEAIQTMLFPWREWDPY